MIRILSLGTFAALVPVASAQAHVVLRPAEAPPGAEATLHFVVGHGCKDAATTALSVELPAGVALVAAEPKAGWALDVDKARRAVTWRGELAAHLSDGFDVKAKLPTAPTRIAFTAVQSCGDQTVRWDQPYSGEGPKPEHPAPVLILAAETKAAEAAAPVGLPAGVQLKDGAFADAAGRPLYTFNFDTMVGMSHCEDDCAQMWPPLIAPKGAKPAGDWTLVTRENGAQQWAYKTKPLYTYSKDQPGGPALGLEAPNWKLAK